MCACVCMLYSDNLLALNACTFVSTRPLVSLPYVYSSQHLKLTLFLLLLVAILGTLAAYTYSRPGFNDLRVHIQHTKLGHNTRRNMHSIAIINMQLASNPGNATFFTTQ